MTKAKTTAAKPQNKNNQHTEEKKFLKISLIVTLIVFIIMYLLFRGSF
jgi:hypothetical protein